MLILSQLIRAVIVRHELRELKPLPNQQIFTECLPGPQQLEANLILFQFLVDYTMTIQ